MIVLYHPPLALSLFLSLTYERSPRSTHLFPGLLAQALVHPLPGNLRPLRSPLQLLLDHSGIAAMAPQQEQDRRGGGDRSTDGEDQRENGAEQFSSKDGGRNEKERRRRGEKRDEGASIFQFRRWRYCGGRGYLATGRIRGTGRGSRARTRTDRHHPRPRLWI